MSDDTAPRVALDLMGRCMEREGVGNFRTRTEVLALYAECLNAVRAPRPAAGGYDMAKLVGS